jgi:hypothetical protein
MKTVTTDIHELARRRVIMPVRSCGNSLVDRTHTGKNEDADDQPREQTHYTSKEGIISHATQDPPVKITNKARPDALLMIIQNRQTEINYSAGRISTV